MNKNYFLTVGLLSSGVFLQASNSIRDYVRDIECDEQQVAVHCCKKEVVSFLKEQAGLRAAQTFDRLVVAIMHEEVQAREELEQLIESDVFLPVCKLLDEQESDRAVLENFEFHRRNLCKLEERDDYVVCKKQPQARVIRNLAAHFLICSGKLYDVNTVSVSSVTWKNLTYQERDEFSEFLDRADGLQWQKKNKHENIQPEEIDKEIEECPDVPYCQYGSSAYIPGLVRMPGLDA